MYHRLVEEIDLAGHRITRYDRNGHDAPDDLWHRHRALNEAYAMANQGKTDREIREYLTTHNVTI